MHTFLKKILLFFLCLLSSQAHAQADSTSVTGITGDFSGALYDVTGRKEWVYVPGVASSKIEIDNRGMAKGVYYLKYYQNGKRKTVKLLKL